MKTKFTQMLRRKGAAEFDQVPGLVELEGRPNSGSPHDVKFPDGTVIPGKIVGVATPASGGGPAFGFLIIEER